MEKESIQTQGRPQAGQRRSPWLKGVSGRLRLTSGTRFVAIVDVQDSVVDIQRGRPGDADAVAITDGDDTLEAIINGRLNPVVAYLQGRLTLEGNRKLAVEVILGLQKPPDPTAPLPPGMQQEA